MKMRVTTTLGDATDKKDYEYIQLNGQADFMKPGLGFGFWLKHDGTPFVARLRFTDASGEWHQVDLFLHSPHSRRDVPGTPPRRQPVLHRRALMHLRVSGSHFTLKEALSMLACALPARSVAETDQR